MAEQPTKILALSSLLRDVASGILTLEELNSLKASLLQGTPVESQSQPSSLIPPSSATSTSTPKSASLKRPSSILDFGITKKVKGGDGGSMECQPAERYITDTKGKSPSLPLNDSHGNLISIIVLG